MLLLLLLLLLLPVEHGLVLIGEIDDLLDELVVVDERGVVVGRRRAIQEVLESFEAHLDLEAEFGAMFEQAGHIRILVHGQIEKAGHKIAALLVVCCCRRCR